MLQYRNFTKFIHEAKKLKASKLPHKSFYRVENYLIYIIIHKAARLKLFVKIIYSHILPIILLLVYDSFLQNKVI